MICIGIDTGVHTGFAVWDSKQRSLLMVTSLPIHKAMENVRSLRDEYVSVGDKVFVRVEDPRQRNWFGTERMSREEERKRLQGGILDTYESFMMTYFSNTIKAGLDMEHGMFEYKFDAKQWLEDFFQMDLTLKEDD